MSKSFEFVPLPLTKQSYLLPLAYHQLTGLLQQVWVHEPITVDTLTETKPFLYLIIRKDSKLGQHIMPSYSFILLL